MLIIITIYLVVKHYQKQPVDWSFSYSRNDKIPYGSYVLYESLPQLFPASDISENNKSFFQADESSIAEKNILIITNYFNPFETDLKILLKHAEKGNNIFIAANSYGKNMADTLGFITTFHWDPRQVINSDTLIMNLVNPQLKRNSGYSFTKNIVEGYFTGFDTAKSVVLGMNRDMDVNFIRVKHGKGNFFIHLFPGAFTNYSMLYDNYSYAENALCYNNNKDIIWDEYYKPGRQVRGGFLFNIILSRPSLRYALYIVLFGLLLYMIFESRRKQRIIPVLAPPRNTSLEFAETIGRLYYHNRDNKDLAIKKFNYFQEAIRSKYYMDMSLEEYSEIRKLSKKSGVPADKLKNIIQLYKYIKDQTQIPDSLCISFYKKIEEFEKISH
mgnify:CR=1 FL=1